MSNNTVTIKTRKNLVSTRTITMTALLAAISYVLAFLEFPVPLSPSFARMDLSDLPALIVNYFILLPLFETFMPLKQLIASFGEFMPFIKTKLDVVLFNALPFNILKGLVIGAITMMIYKKLTPILKGETLK
mgnify:CR=1 FL=1